jgi:hypothetical protein
VNRRDFLKAAALPVMAGWPGCQNGPRVVRRPKYYDRQQRLIAWMVAEVQRNAARHRVHLVSALPSGRTHAERDRRDLENLYWLQNNNLYAAHALRPHAPDLARAIEADYQRFYREDFPGAIERTEHYYSVGLPAEPMPPSGRYYRLEALRRDHGAFSTGTEVNVPDQLARIQDNDPRSLLKFGVLGEVLRGDRERAHGYFDQAMALWDGHGFLHTRWERHRSYYGRYLAFALIADNALRRPLPAALREQLEDRLWSIQDTDGGIWTNYNADGSFPALAKKTMEVGPLALLATNPAIWGT